jgi:hypothetical protein
MRVLGCLATISLFCATTFLGFFWLGSKEHYDEMMQAGALPVFFERAAGISLFGLGGGADMVAAELAAGKNDEPEIN